MGVNPIRKRRATLRGVGVLVVGVVIRDYRERWYGVCPDCGEEVIDRDPYQTSTRKRAKDALHRHRKHDHLSTTSTPSPVG